MQHGCNPFTQRVVESGNDPCLRALTRTVDIGIAKRNDIQAMHEAFKEGVDDFLNKANLRGQLLPRVFAAQRIAERQNELLRTNKLLRRKVRELTTTDLVDPVTGLGNMKFTLERISSLSKEVEARGGAACVLLVGINNLAVIEKQYDKAVSSAVP